MSSAILRAESHGSLRFLLLPGFGGTGRLFQHLMQLLPAGSRSVVAQYPADASSLEELSAAAARCVDEWESTIVISESMGSLVAVDLCSRMGRSPRAAIFSCSFARPPKPWWIDLGLALPGPLLHWLAANPLAIRYACVGGADQSLVDTVRDVTSAFAAGTLRHRLQLIRRTDIRPQLSALRMPSLYLQATRDRLIPPSLSDEFCSLVPGIQRVAVPGPHLLLQACPRECFAHIDAFLSSVGAGVSRAAQRTSSR